MQLLILKILYILFNTKGLSEYFYTNDLCVLVDVFLREIVDLDEDSESVRNYVDSMSSSNPDNLQLRHTYLRVLHPLLTRTQLRSLPYKRPQIVRALESLIANQEIREVSTTTKRLVERCLNGEWYVHHTPSGGGRVSAEHGMQRPASPSSDRVAAQSLTPKPNVPAPPNADPSLFRRRSLKGSRSAENLRGLATADAKPVSRTLEALRKPTNDSTLALAIASSPTVTHPQRAGSETLPDKRPADRRPHARPPAARELILPIPVRHGSLGTVSDQPLSPPAALSSSVPVPVLSPPSPLVPAYARISNVRVPPPSPVGSAASGTSTASGTKKVHRRSPPPPPKRRKPPAVPMRVVGTSNGGAEIAAIASSTSSLSLGKSRKT
jgi:hypothetical protein